MCGEGGSVLGVTLRKLTCVGRCCVEQLLHNKKRRALTSTHDAIYGIIHILCMPDTLGVQKTDTFSVHRESDIPVALPVARMTGPDVGHALR